METLDDLRESTLRHFTNLPPWGTPAAELTDRDKVALALAAGAPYKTSMSDGRLTVTTGPVGITDRGDGGYIVAIRQEAR